MLLAYLEILRNRGAWRFSLAGFVLRLPMSMIGICLILLIKATYGNYALAGLVSAINIIATAIVAPVLSRLVDQYGQLKIMGPALTVSALSTAGLLGGALVHVSPVLVCVLAALAGATWGAPGALVRSRWTTVTDRPRQLATAYAFESAMDEVVYILGPILSTVLGTALHPATSLILLLVFLTVGGVAFFSQRASEPTPMPREPDQSRSSLIRIPAVLVLALTYVGAGAMFGANDISVVEFATELGEPAMSGVLLAFFSFGSFVAALIYGARTWRTPLWRLYRLGIITMAVGASTFLLARSLSVMAAVMLVTGMACAPTMINVTMLISKVVKPARLTEGLTWMSTSLNLGLSLGSAFAGPAIDAVGARGGYLVMVAAAWVMAVLMLVGLTHLRRACGDDASGERRRFALTRSNSDTGPRVRAQWLGDPEEENARRTAH